MSLLFIKTVLVSGTPTNADSAPTITIIRLDTSAVVASSASMVAVATGEYVYAITQPAAGVEYLATITATVNLSTVTTTEVRSVGSDVTPAPRDLTTTIAEVAANPKETSVDGQSTAEHPIKDLIAADKYQKANAAAQAGGLPFGFVKFVRPGAAGINPRAGDDQMNRFFDDPDWR